jgi:hypothetical protein
LQKSRVFPEVFLRQRSGNVRNLSALVDRVSFSLVTEHSADGVGKDCDRK